MSPEMTARYKDIIKEDRQWLRPLRLQHAKYELKRATTDEEKELWGEIIKANSY